MHTLVVSWRFLSAMSLQLNLARKKSLCFVVVVDFFKILLVKVAQRIHEQGTMSVLYIKNLLHVYIIVQASYKAVLVVYAFLQTLGDLYVYYVTGCTRNYDNEVLYVPRLV